MARECDCTDAASGLPVAAQIEREVRAVYHTIHLTARVGALAADPDLADRLLTELERLEAARRLSAPVTAQNQATGTTGAGFCIDNAPSAAAALTTAQAAFAEALAAATGRAVTAPVYTEIQATEEHEEAAALA